MSAWVRVSSEMSFRKFARNGCETISLFREIKGIFREISYFANNHFHVTNRNEKKEREMVQFDETGEKYKTKHV